MLKYKVIGVCIQKTPYGEWIKDTKLEEAFEEGWQYLTCNQIGDWLHYVLKKEVVK